MSDGVFTNPTVQAFHDLYRRQTAGEGPPRVYWFGHECVKCPLDLWIYQEILHELRPAWVIEGGTCSGGTALFLAHMLDIMSGGRVITIDWDASDSRPAHPRITQLIGNTLHQSTVDAVAGLVRDQYPRMLILDDGHDHEHVYRELCCYVPLLRAGDVLVVEDTNLGGPLWGLDRFIAEHPGKLERDRHRERLLMTQNPRGYLKVL